MAWTTPGTAVAGATATAAFWNANVRDNMLETYPAAVSAAGDLAYADGANSLTRLAHPGATGYLLASNGASGLAWRQVAEDIDYQDGATSYTGTSTTYTAGDGSSTWAGLLPKVTVTTGTLAIAWVSCASAWNSTAGGLTILSYSVSGATTRAADDAHAGTLESGNANDRGPIVAVRLESLTAGSNTFQMEAKVTTGTGTIDRPRILVMAL